jgi:hypothetical protein
MTACVMKKEKQWENVVFTGGRATIISDLLGSSFMLIVFLSNS